MKKVLKGLGLSVLALVVAFLAMSLPFHLFTELSSEGMTIVFTAEIVIYLALGLGFIALNERKKQQKAKMKLRHEMRSAKIKQVQKEWYDLVA